MGGLCSMSLTGRFWGHHNCPRPSSASKGYLLLAPFSDQTCGDLNTWLSSISHTAVTGLAVEITAYHNTATATIPAPAGAIFGLIIQTVIYPGQIRLMFKSRTHTWLNCKGYYTHWKTVGCRQTNRAGKL